MEKEHSELLDLRQIVRNGWKAMLGAALGAAGLMFLFVLFKQPVVFVAEAILVVLPVTGADGREARQTTDLYRTLLESDAILQSVQERLLADGILEETDHWNPTQTLRSELEGVGGNGDGQVIKLTARGETSSRAAAMANAWAEVFKTESRTMTDARTEEAKRIFESSRTTTRARLEEVEAEKVANLASFQEREEKTARDWDRKIFSAQEATANKIVACVRETRRAMEGAVAEAGPWAEANPVVAELVTLRVNLSRTSRLVDLEKAASDETLAELILDRADADQFDRTVVSQEIDPLHGDLTLRSLDLEQAILGSLTTEKASATSLLARLEEIEAERSAQLSNILQQGASEIRSYRRQRSQDLKLVAWERASNTVKLDRELEELVDLENRLTKRINTTVLSGLFDEVDDIRLAAPAVASVEPEPRRLPQKVAAALLLGGFLGFFFSLWRSVFWTEQDAQ